MEMSTDSASPPLFRPLPSRRGGVVLVGVFVLSLFAADLHPLTHPGDEARPCVVCQIAEQPLDGDVAPDPVPALHPSVEVAPAPVVAGPPCRHQEGDHVARAPPEGGSRST